MKRIYSLSIMPLINRVCNLSFTGMLIAISFIIGSCGSETDQQNETQEPADSVADDESANQFKVKKSEKVFYTVPSPLEVNALLKRAGATYNKELLNGTENISKYSTTTSMALNLGIYGADLSYTSMFDQTQEIMLYFSCVKRLADKLGITSSLNKVLIDRVEKNIENRDSLVQMISDYYWESDAYLKENKQSSTAALVIAGGWIESIFIGSQLVKTTGNREIIGRIGEQKMSLNNLIALLESYIAEDPTIKPWIAELEQLRNAYEGVEIRYTRDQPVTDPKTSTTTISTVSTVAINDQQFSKIQSTVEALRTKIINF